MKKKYFLGQNYFFQKIINEKNKKINQCYFVYCLPNNLEFNRFGISIGKKLLNAVGRNKVKRQIKSMLHQLNLATMQIDKKTKLDIVIMVRPLYLKNDFNTNCQNLFSVLQTVKQTNTLKN